MHNNLLKFSLNIALSIGILAIFSGCGSKYYFEPKDEEILGEISYDGTFAPRIGISSVVRNGATLTNGQFITENSEIPKVYLSYGSKYLNQTEQYYLIQNKKTLVLIDKENLQETEIELESIPVSAAMDGNLIAIIFDTNTIAVYDTRSAQIIYRQDNAPATANNTLIAAPYFLTDIIVVPTLDGKLIVIDKQTMQLIRNIVVNGDKYFNNVIFLEAIANRMVAATPKRVISVSPSIINTFDANVKEILFFEDRIFIFSSEGEVILTDRDLNEIRRVKFPFAHFSAVNHGQNIVVLETEGYLITLDEDLQKSAIDEPTFSGTNKIFIGNKFLNIK